LHKNAGTLALAEGSPTNVRCKAPHLIKIILAYSPKKKRADPIEDVSEGGNGSNVSSRVVVDQLELSLDGINPLER
jgi:hypothetical protein